ncbi:hypothetical protein [Brevundimonas lenta]|uniref:Uncharacterized protein n=1 Tax=Brevundimonas lenta TaxID=424796 RepID=A0A7W6NP13_9CAUL|nr:hypothetical protein [Brevundimonas lenta]MBB4081722.1 hypothetical protein [Brevundimonas lenta]
MPSATASRQTGLKRLAGALAFVCLVLALMALEQRHTVAAWHMLRDEAGPAISRVVGWVAGGAKDGASGLKAAAADVGPVATAADDQILSGEFAAGDEVTRSEVGGVTFVAATIGFDAGEALHTSPLRIAAGRETFMQGLTWSDRFDAPADAQIELRRVDAAAPSPLCDGRRPAVVALLHRGRKVDLILFRSAPGPEARPSAVCGIWSFRKR